MDNELQKDTIRRITDLDIVMSWLSISANMNKLPVLVLTKEVYDFIAATSDMIEYNGEKAYKTGGAWYRLKRKIKFDENEKFSV